MWFDVIIGVSHEQAGELNASGHGSHDEQQGVVAGNLLQDHSDLLSLAIIGSECDMYLTRSGGVTVDDAGTAVTTNGM